MSINTENMAINGILAFLPEDKKKYYLESIYAIAKAAIEAKCPSLPIADLEIMAGLEDESNARFEEWIFQ